MPASGLHVDYMFQNTIISQYGLCLPFCHFAGWCHKVLCYIGDHSIKVGSCVSDQLLDRKAIRITFICNSGVNSANIGYQSART